MLERRIFHTQIRHLSDVFGKHPMMYSPRSQKFEPLTSKQWAVAGWNRAAPIYASQWMPMQKPIYEAVASQCLRELRNEKYPSILDICSGAGEPALTLANKLPGSDIVSTDIAADNIGLGNMRNKTGGGILFQYADAEDLQFDNDSFDLVVCCLGLFFCDEQLALSQMLRVAKSGAPVLVVEYAEDEEVDHLRPWKIVVDKLCGSVKIPRNHGLNPCRAGDQQIDSAMTSAGFINVRKERRSVSLGWNGSSFDQLWSRALSPLLRAHLSVVIEQGLIEKDLETALEESKEAYRNAVCNMRFLHTSDDNILQFPNVSLVMYIGYKP